MASSVLPVDQKQLLTKFMLGAYKEFQETFIHFSSFWKKELEALYGNDVAAFPFLFSFLENLSLNDAEAMKNGLLVMEELRKAESLVRKASILFLKEKLKEPMTDEEDELSLLFDPSKLR